MIELNVSEAKRLYNETKFGNPPCERGNVVWIRENGSEYPVKVV